MHSFIAHIRKSKNERGDTLVEVMIAIAVVSLILGGAYATTNRSLQATRAAQERAIALKLAESQIERLKNVMATTPSVVMAIPESDEFCISYTSNQPITLPNDDCNLNTQGVRATEQPIFQMSIERTGNTFVLTERWENINGKVVDSLQLRYRVYE